MKPEASSPDAPTRLHHAMDYAAMALIGAAGSFGYWFLYDKLAQFW